MFECLSRTVDADTTRLLPTQFASLLDVAHRTGELKQVAMSFIRLNGTDDLLADEGIDGVHRRARRDHRHRRPCCR